MSAFKMHIPPMETASFPIVTMSHGVSIRPPRSQSSSPDYYSIQGLIRNTLNSCQVSISQVERLAASLYRVYLLRLHDGRIFVLKIPPQHTVRLLSHERQELMLESQILDLISTDAQVPVPRNIRCELQAQTLETPYLLRTYVAGTPLNKLSPYLSSPEWAHINYSIGYYMQRITSISVNSFGPASKVLSGAGAPTWREAFLSLIESALRDAEDLLISLPYESIRRHALQFSPLLESITVARLVPMEAGLPHTVLIDEQTRQVSGMLGFGHVVFGDPMLATVFADASGAFWEGFGLCPARAGPELVRQLLYTLYRAVMMVVTQYYRPNYDDQELEARRSLTWALNQLDSIEGPSPFRVAGPF